MEKNFNEFFESLRDLCGRFLETGVPSEAPGEDERIRKFLVKHISEWIGCIEHDLKISSKDVESEEELAMFKAGLAWLEKQKENPKSADSIPSDCTSDAKYEDRWHKVEDSLPDNGREVLAKDKLGNTLLARYDGEGWDVSVYDDEDYRCHIGISKWCEIPSEKQKEQIPYTDFVIKPHKGDDNNPYDMSASEAQEYAIKRGFDVPFNDGEVYVDERHLTQTVGNILRWADEHPKEQKLTDDKAFEEWIDDWWKHNKVNNPDSYDKGDEIQFDERGFKNFCRGIRNMYQQQPAEWSEEDEKKLELVIDFIYNFYPDPVMKYELKDWLKSLRPSWKPSEEQMEALKCAIADVAKFSKRGGRQVELENEPYYRALHSLYCNLEKLM